MKIFSVSQIRAADAYTIANEPISSIDLMERAARACYHWFHTTIKRNLHIGILCGKGNNGGDGLALARMLALGGFTHVSVYIIEHTETASEDFKANYQRLSKTNVSCKSARSTSEIPKHDVYVDAILGSGLNKPLRGMIAHVVSELNNREGLKVAIDIPTGLFADSNAQNTIDHVFTANDTLSFQFPKWSFLFPEFGSYAGSIHILDIGLSETYVNQTQTTNYFIDEKLIEPILPIREKFDHKGTYGHALLIAGSKGKNGAAILATKAAIRAGAGLVTAYIPKCGTKPIQSANPEVMVVEDEGESMIEHIHYTLDPSAIGVGPGIGTDPKTASACIKFVENQERPLVLDADGLNCLAALNGVDKLPKQSILTPHMGELDRLLGKRYRGEEVYDAARLFAQKHELILVVKGAHSAIYTPSGNVYFNSTGTNGMATAGSGDVLTGMITGFLAQGIEPVHAAICGVYFHGKAGEAAALEKSDSSMTAIDLLDYLKIEL